jgi:hypothetical protein
VTSATTQPPHEPDEFEKLRRARGEGWQWNRIQAEPCPQCGDNPAAFPPESLATLVVERTSAWRGFLVHADDHFLRHIPEPGVFSPIQYAAHVNGVLRVSGDRLLLGMEQDGPVVPMFNPSQDEWAAYNLLDAEELANDLEHSARRVADILGEVGPSDWSRTVVNDRGPYGVYTFTLAGIGRNAVHESHHHLLDAKGTLDPNASP